MMKNIGLLVTCLMLVKFVHADERLYEADPSLYELMDATEAEFFPYNLHPSTIYWPHDVSGGGHITIYAPDTQSSTTQRIIAAYQQGGQILESLFQVNSPSTVKVFLVQEIKASDVRAQAIRVMGQLLILIEVDDYIEHSFLHEYMHHLQRMANAHPYATGISAFLGNTSGYADAWRWYVEGPPQFAPLITGAPDNWVNKPLLYGDAEGFSRFQLAIRNAHGKSLVDRQHLASLFWYYYFNKVHSGSRTQLSSAILTYRDQGFNNENMSWFKFSDYWHDFALAQLNLPGDKTGVLKSIDGNFSMVDTSARDRAEIISLPEPFGEMVELKPLSQKYFVVESLFAANDHVVFSLPDKDIPEGVEISAVLRRTDTAEETWEALPIDQSTLGEYGFMRFPMDGKKDLEVDSSVAYDGIIFVLSNYSDTDTHEIDLVITNHLAAKYEGRGVELESGTKYVMTGTSILTVPRKGDGYRLFVEDDEIHTRVLQAWFQRVPVIDFDEEDDLNRKALTYVRDNGVFRGDVYFKYLGLRPEKVEKVGDRKVESGKLIVERERKENFYDTPNLFKIVLDQQDLLIMFGADVRAAAVFTKKIEDIVATKYAKGTFGGTLSQLFQQTIAIDTRAYNQKYEVSYKRGTDDKGMYLKLKLGESMWFILRETELAGLQKIIH